ncbi:Pectate lyase [Madurella fahalii]|uniref:Pectate lyase n=1 Tax=Madurella fahalii TaxID=1157608 RepID=A0ABQ0GGX0_9PEZI
MQSTILTILASAALAAAQTNTNLQTNFPTATSTTHLAAARTLAAGENFDGRMLQWDRNQSTCSGQAEGGEKDAVFILQDGATLSNVIIGPNNGEGVHCKGTCTLNNVWWTDVCEDAATFRQASGTSYVNGGGARGASDKVFQHNGGGTVAVKNFFASNIGKLYRSCGNCSKQYARHSTFTNVRVVDKASVVAGVNSNLGDTTVVRDSCVLAGATCWLYEGNSSGDEPRKIGSGPSGTACSAIAVQTQGC